MLMLTNSSVLAAIDVEGTTATFAWTPSSGPAAYYTVYLDRNGAGFTNAVEAWVSEPRVTLHGESGETIRICVMAWGWTGDSLLGSAPSELSDEVRFVESAGSPPTPFPTPVPTPIPTPIPTPVPTPISTPVPTPIPTPVPTPPLPDPPPPLPVPPAGTAPYDFDGDGRTDLLWHNSQTNVVNVWLMNGASPSRTAVLARLKSGWSVVGSGDFDGDGRADLLLRVGTSAQYGIWFMNGVSVRTGAVLMAPALCDGVDAIGDFDGDGYADLQWRCSTNSLVWFMRGASVSEAVPGPQAAGLPVCAPELDGDGRSDVLWSGLDETVAWLMEGSSPWWSGPAGPLMSQHGAVGCADADGDGTGDVLWYNPNSRRGTLWRMDGDTGGVDQSFALSRLRSGWAIEASGDFDGDGRANDILIRNRNTGRIEVWELRWNSQLSGFSVDSTRGPGMGNADWKVVAP
jgi:hypothetical protein